MKTISFLLFAILAMSNEACAEQSYTMIPDTVNQVEQFSKAADNLGRTRIQQAPRTAAEAIHRLHRIDAELDRIIAIASRFQQTTRLLEKGIRETQQFVRKNKAFVIEWEPVLRGNYQLIHASLDGSTPDDMRTMVAIQILENLLHSISMRMASADVAMNLQLKFSREARVIHAAQRRVHFQLADIRKELKVIHDTAQTRM